MTAAPLGLTLDRLKVTHAGQTYVDLSLTIAPGEVLTLMAPSGSGKTTALLALAGALPPGFAQTGRIFLHGRPIDGLPTVDRRIGLLFAEDGLFAHLSTGGNLAFALPRRAGESRAARALRIDQALADMGLQGFAPRDPATLSSGQRARVSLARALLADPQAMALDEPFTRLDAGLRAQIRDLVFAAARARGLPTLLVTHDPDDARAAGGPVLDPLGRPVSL